MAVVMCGWAAGAVLQARKSLPRGADITDAIEYLLYLQAIEQGLAGEAAGRLISHEEVLEQIKTWLK
jgi:predicted transcriptional regulator